jgi:hypothetical protein
LGDALYPDVDEPDGGGGRDAPSDLVAKTLSSSTSRPYPEQCRQLRYGCEDGVGPVFARRAGALTRLYEGARIEVLAPVLREKGSRGARGEELGPIAEESQEPVDRIVGPELIGVAKVFVAKRRTLPASLIAATASAAPAIGVPDE